MPNLRQLSNSSAAALPRTGSAKLSKASPSVSEGMSPLEDETSWVFRDVILKDVGFDKNSFRPVAHIS